MRPTIVCSCKTQKAYLVSCIRKPSIELGIKESVLLPETNLKRKNQESGLDNQEQLLLHHHLNIA